MHISLTRNKTFPAAIFAALILAVSAGCGSGGAIPTATLSPIDSAFMAKVAPVALTSYISISPRERFVYHLDYQAEFYISNLYDDCLFFRPDFGASIWYLISDSWHQIDEVGAEPTGNDVLLETSDSMLSTTPLYVFPDSSVIEKYGLTTLRVFVSGQLCRNGKPQGPAVGAFLDFEVVK